MILIDLTGFTVTGRTFINYLLASCDRDDFLFNEKLLQNSNCISATQRSPKWGKHTRRGNGGVSFGSEEGSFSGCLWPGVGAAISEAWRVFLGGKLPCWHGFDAAKLNKNSGLWGMLWFGSSKHPVIHYLIVFSFKAMRASVTTWQVMWLTWFNVSFFCCILLCDLCLCKCQWNMMTLVMDLTRKDDEVCFTSVGKLGKTHPKARLDYSIWGIYKHKLSKWEETE